MKQIFFIVDTLQNGGAERIISELTSYLANDYQITLITINQNKKLSDFYYLNKKIKRIRIHENIYKVNYVLKIFRIIKIILKLRFQIKFHQPQTIVSFLTFSNIISIISSIGIRIKKIISERVDTTKLSRNVIYNFLTYIFYGYADLLIVQSKIVKELFNKIEIKKMIIYNHVRRLNKNLRSNKNLFINISRLDKEKNIFFLIDVFKNLNLNLNHRNKKFQLEIIGEGILKKKLNNYCKKNSINKYIKFSGKIKSIDKKFKNKRFYIQVSKAEGMSNVILESMSAKLPCIILKEGKMHEKFVNKKNCFIINSCNAQKFTKKVLEINNYSSKKINKITNNGKKLTKNLNINVIDKKRKKII